MKWPRRKRWWVVALAGLASLIATWSFFGRGRPVVKLIGLREENGERIAMLEVLHEPEESVVYFPTVFVRSSRGVPEKIGATWTGKDAASGVTFGDSVLKTEPFKLRLPSAYASQPFEIGVEFLEPPSGIWQLPPLRWIAPSQVKSRIAWSCPITP